MTLVVAHDYVTQQGGAERVALHLTSGFGADRLITSVYEPGNTFREFADFTIETTPLQRIAAFRRDPRRALPFLASAWSSLPPVDAEAVICSSSGWSHGLRTAGRTRKVVYCHNTARWLWQPEDYVLGLDLVGRLALRAFGSRLRRWDVRQALSANQYVANSLVVRDRIRTVYGFDAPVVSPPVGLSMDGDVSPVPGLAPGFLLTIARDRGYKQTDVLMNVLGGLGGRTVVVVGSDPPRTRPSPDVIHLGRVTDAQLRWLYREAHALVSASREDFGLTPIEANQFGTPAVTIRAGGFLETITEGRNGVFFDDLCPESVLSAVERAGDLDAEAIVSASEQYQPARFIERMSRYV